MEDEHIQFFSFIFIRNHWLQQINYKVIRNSVNSRIIEDLPRSAESTVRDHEGEGEAHTQMR